MRWRTGLRPSECCKKIPLINPNQNQKKFDIAFPEELHCPPNEAKRIASDAVVVFINGVFLKSEAIVELYQLASFCIRAQPYVSFDRHKMLHDGPTVPLVTILTGDGYVVEFNTVPRLVMGDKRVSCDLIAFRVFREKAGTGLRQQLNDSGRTRPHIVVDGDQFLNVSKRTDALNDGSH